MKKGLLLIAAMLLIIPFTADAGCGSCGNEAPGHTHEKGHEATHANAKSVDMKTFEGTLVCLGCTLKAEGANAACKINGGCSHAIKTADGKFINLLDNKYSKALIKGGEMHNKPIKVTGTYFASAQTLDVQSYEFEGNKKSWCDHCSAMDGCMAKK